MIYESKYLSSINSSTIFSKLHEHEIKLKCLTKSKEGYKKNKSLALKATYIKDMESEDTICQNERDEDMNLLFCKFKEFPRHENNLQNSKSKVKKDQPLCQYALNA